jgi:extradiol dioxygenase
MDIFGISYIGYESPNYQEMADYCPEVYGFELNDRRGGDAVYLKMDDATFRLAIHPGERNRLAYIGWEMQNRWAFESAVETLAAAGVDVTIGDADLEAERGVHGLAQFRDPAGWPHELCYGQGVDPQRFRPGRGHAGFCSDEHGVGHTVLTTHSLSEVEDFCKNVMAFNWFGHGLVKNFATFWRAKHNVLSHNVGYALHPKHQYGDTARGLPHLGIYARELDDVGIAYDLAQARGANIGASLGRHAQDPVVSFYAETPAGFTIECCWLTPECHMPAGTHVERRAERLSVWGHHMPEAPPELREALGQRSEAEPAPAGSRA